MSYSLLGSDGVQSGLAMQIEVIPSHQTFTPVKLHTVAFQTRDFNILGWQESRIEYIPVCRIMMLCCWVSSILKDYSVFVFRVRQAKNNSCSLLLHSCRAG